MLITEMMAEALCAGFRKQGKKIVFTNGVFDILHQGHLESLQKAKSYGDVLIVGINSDASVKKIKGPKRPIVPERERANLVAALKPVDYVVIFGETDPRQIILKIKPSVHVKGDDYKLKQIIERKVVEANGGKVVLVPTNSLSTTRLINQIIERYSK